MTDDKNDYKVGYGKPPKHSQFKPGETGNKKGRTRGKKNFLTELQEELMKKIMIQENGKNILVTKEQVVVRQLVNKACKGDPKATEQVISHRKHIDKKVEEKRSTEALDEHDEEILQRWNEGIIRETFAAMGIEPSPAALAVANRRKPEEK